MNHKSRSPLQFLFFFFPAMSANSIFSSTAHKIEYSLRLTVLIFNFDMMLFCFHVLSNFYFTTTQSYLPSSDVRGQN